MTSPPKKNSKKVEVPGFSTSAKKEPSLYHQTLPLASLYLPRIRNPEPEPRKNLIQKKFLSQIIISFLRYHITNQSQNRNGCNKFSHSASVWFLFSVLTMCFTPLYTQVFELILTSVSLHSELQKFNNECTCKKILFIEKLPFIFKDENSQSRDSEMFLLRGEIRIL